MTIAFNPAIPIFRIFSEEKAREFYLDFLGFRLDWEHRFEPDMPIYMQVSRGSLVLHLSEHHGDATPGSTAYVRMRGVRDYHAEISARGYRHLRPGVEQRDWTEAEMTVIDPFGNRIRFGEIMDKNKEVLNA
jgi:catechol 2,3-dioxygenase-like lactoylglutathione lyase family enzyme